MVVNAYIIVRLKPFLFHQTSPPALHLHHFHFLPVLSQSEALAVVAVVVMTMWWYLWCFFLVMIVLVIMIVLLLVYSLCSVIPDSNFHVVAHVDRWEVCHNNEQTHSSDWHVYWTAWGSLHHIFAFPQLLCLAPPLAVRHTQHDSLHIKRGLLTLSCVISTPPTKHLVNFLL